MNYLLALVLVGAVVWLVCLLIDPVPVQPEPTPLLGLPAADGWRPETSWRPLGQDRSTVLVNARGWLYNHNPVPVGTDEEWLIPLPEWLHPRHGLRTL